MRSAETVTAGETAATVMWFLIRFNVVPDGPDAASVFTEIPSVRERRSQEKES